MEPEIVPVTNTVLLIEILPNDSVQLDIMFGESKDCDQLGYILSSLSRNKLSQQIIECLSKKLTGAEVKTIVEQWSRYNKSDSLVVKPRDVLRDSVVSGNRGQ